MNDTIEVTLPVSGYKVVIRNYTTHADDNAARAILQDGVTAERTDGDTKPSLKFSIANVSASKDVYVSRLVQSINGDSTNIAGQLENMRSADYTVIENTVNNIVEDNSPKVSEAKSASSSATSTK